MRDTLGTASSAAWAGGIVKAVDPFILPANTSPRGLNTALALGRTGVPYIQKRMGVLCLTTTAITGSAPIIGQHDYMEVSTGTRRHLCTTETNIEVKGVDGLFTVLGSPLTSAEPPSFATANNMAFLFNGTDAYKIRGTVIENVGIVRPVVATLSGSSGAVGLHDGEYELRVAYKNDNTGHISSASNTASSTVIVSEDEIDWFDVPVSPDPQVTSRLLLIRNIDTQAQFYVAGEINDNVTTTATTSVLDENLVVVAPTTTNRNPPPTGIKACTVYRGRLVVTDGIGIYWSEIDEPEAFDVFSADFIDSSGDVITGVAVDQDTLLVLKDDRTHAINGELAGGYTLVQLDANIGCIAHKTICSAAGSTFWWSRQGIIKYTNGTVERIGMSTYGDPRELVNANAISVASAVTHDERGTIYFALPDVGQTRATFILPFNYILGVLESERWDPMDVASLGRAEDGNGVLQPVIGGYSGQVFQLWSGNNDGVRAGTSTGGTFVASSDNITTIEWTDPNGLVVDFAGSGLLERKITIIDSAGGIVTQDLRPRIIANGVVNIIDFTPAVTVTSGETYTLVIGGPNFQFDTPWRNFGDEWVKKRFEYLFLLIKGALFGSAASVVMSFDYDELNLTGKDRTFVSTAVGSVFDEAVFDVDVWDTAQNLQRRYRVARTGRSWRTRIINAGANQPFAVLLVAAQAVGQTVKQ